MASGSSGRTGSGSKGFDFGSDDILCSYDDFGNQDASNGNHTDPVIGGNNSGKDFRESRMRSALLHSYNQHEETLSQDVISTVEKTMKKYADNLLRFLEGISARLSQLELYCYNLESSIGEMRSDLIREHSEADSKLISLEKHLQEVHRAVQILRDKQELAEAQKELAKLQLVQKESSTASRSQHKEEGVAPSAADPKKPESTMEIQNQQLALALPHQVPPTSLPTRPMEQHQPLAPPPQTPSQNMHVQTQPHTYYPQQAQLPSNISQAQNHPQDQYLQADPQYQRPHMQVPQQGPQPQPPPQSHVSQPQQVHPLPPYQQQWPQQFPQQVQPPPQQPSQQVQIRPQTPPVYPPYTPNQPTNPSPETFSASMPMQVPLSGIPQSGVSRSEPMGYGYSGPTRSTVQQQPPQHNMQRLPQPQTHQNNFGAPLGEGAYPGAGPQPTQAPRQGYMIYDGEGGRVPYPPPPHFPQGGYPPTNISSLQNPQQIRHPSPPQMMRSHPYSEMIEKAVSMGYGRDHVVSVIQRMEESGQPVDFNSVLDMLNVHSSGGSQRAWSG